MPQFPLLKQNCSSFCLTENEWELWGSIYFSMSTFKSWCIYSVNIEWMDPASEAKLNLYNIYDKGSSSS